MEEQKMAITGLSNQRYALIDSETGLYTENKPFMKAITSSFEPEYAEGSLYADNTRIEYAKELVGGTLTLTNNDNNPAVFGEILGLPYNETTGLLQFGTNSNPPFVGFGEIGEVSNLGIKQYEVRFFKKVKFSAGFPEYSTKTDSINYGTIETQGAVFVGDDGNMLVTRRFSTFEEAQAALVNMFYTTALTAPTLAQPASESASITASGTVAGNILEYRITSANGAATTTGTVESEGTTTEIAAPEGNWQNGMKVQARSSDVQTGQNSDWSAVLTVALS
jgi:hypothetical protein